MIIAHPLSHKSAAERFYDLHTASSCLAFSGHLPRSYCPTEGAVCSSIFSFRKLQPIHSSQLKSPQSNHSFHKTPGDSPSQLSPAKNLSTVIIHLQGILFSSTSSFFRIRTDRVCPLYWNYDVTAVHLVITVSRLK